MSYLKLGIGIIGASVLLSGRPVGAKSVVQKTQWA